MIGVLGDKDEMYEKKKLDVIRDFEKLITYFEVQKDNFSIAFVSHFVEDVISQQKIGYNALLEGLLPSDKAKGYKKSNVLKK